MGKLPVKNLENLFKRRGVEMKCLKCLLFSAILALPCYAEIDRSYWVVFGDKELNLSTRVYASVYINDTFCRLKDLDMFVSSSKAGSFELKKNDVWHVNKFSHGFFGCFEGIEIKKDFKTVLKIGYLTFEAQRELLDEIGFIKGR
jgi:hypothetical protein